MRSIHISRLLVTYRFRLPRSRCRQTTPPIHEARIVRSKKHRDRRNCLRTTHLSRQDQGFEQLPRLLVDSLGIRCVDLPRDQHVHPDIPALQFIEPRAYDRTVAKKSILNPVDANYVDSDPDKPQRQLYGNSISAKRYALYEKIGDADTKIVDPKAHGIGFLYPPRILRRNGKKTWRNGFMKFGTTSCGAFSSKNEKHRHGSTFRR